MGVTFDRMAMNVTVALIARRPYILENSWLMRPMKVLDEERFWRRPG